MYVMQFAISVLLNKGECKYAPETTLKEKSIETHLRIIHHFNVQHLAFTVLFPFCHYWPIFHPPLFTKSHSTPFKNSKHLSVFSLLLVTSFFFFSWIEWNRQKKTPASMQRCHQPAYAKLPIYAFKMFVYAVRIHVLVIIWKTHISFSFCLLSSMRTLREIGFIFYSLTG